MTEKKTVPESLAALGEIYKDRNMLYGDDYKGHGNVMMALFPMGIVLNNQTDFNRYSCLKEIVTKISRYAMNFNRGGHDDSLDDIAVYSQMLKELDNDGQK